MPSKRTVKITFEDGTEKLFNSITEAAINFESQPSNFHILLQTGKVSFRLKTHYGIKSMTII